MHTTFCDGKNSPEQMVLSAIDKGLKTVGVLLHSYLTFTRGGSCKSVESEKEFAKEINDLKQKYADKIKVLCGIEMDFHSEHKAEGFDYILGSVHFFEKDGKYYPIDKSFIDLKYAVDTAFGGDVYSACEQYFENVSQVVEKHNADIIGHLDLVTKFNEQNPYIDEKHPRYVTAWKKAVDKLLLTGKPFEINTGAISRGYRTTPYPSFDMIDYIKARGGKLIMSSDSHSAENIRFQYDQWKKLL